MSNTNEKTFLKETNKLLHDAQELKAAKRL